MLGLISVKATAFSLRCKLHVLRLVIFNRVYGSNDYLR